MGRAVQVEALWNGLRDNSGNPLVSGKVYSYAAGTTTPKALYTASDKSASATNPAILDAYGRSQLWADGAYKLVIKTSADVTLYTLDNQLYGYDSGEIIWGSTSAGTGNAQTITVTGSITSYVAGQRYSFIAGNSNSAAASLNVNGLGAVSIVKGATPSSLVSGDIISGTLVEVVYDSGGGGRFRLADSPDQWGSAWIASINGSASSGTPTAYVTSSTPAWSSLGVLRPLIFVPHATNTGAATLNHSGLGAISISYRGTPLVGGEIVNGRAAMVAYDGGTWNLFNHGGQWNSTFSPTYTCSGTMTFGTITSSLFKYQQHGNRVDFIMHATGTIGGVASYGIRFTVPVTISSTVSVSFTAAVFNGTAARVAGACEAIGGTTIQVSKFDSSNYTLGVGYSIHVSGSYDVA